MSHSERHETHERHGEHIIQEHFRQFAHRAAVAAGAPWAFALGVGLILAWAVSGPYFGYAEEWQLVVNTGTTIVTFLMVFIIQNTQARDSREVHVKLDELLRAVERARTRVILSEDLTDEELEQLQADLRAAAGKPASGEPSEAC